MFMTMLILNDTEKCQDVLHAWAAAGAPGVTILRSTGLGRVLGKSGLRDNMPLFPGLNDFFEEEESLHRTLIAIVGERAVVDKIIQATQAVLGDLTQPDTGILVVLPVLEAYGLVQYNQ